MRKLSGSEKYNSKSTLAQIANKSDKELTKSDFHVIFHPILPSGTFHESMGYWNIFNSNLIEGKLDIGEFSEHIIAFLSNNKSSLINEKRFTDIVNTLELLINEKLWKFHIKHYDKIECKKQGWGLEYENVVENSHIILDYLVQLSKSKNLDSLLDNFFINLNQMLDATRSLWKLELYYNALEESIFSRKVGKKILMEITTQEILESLEFSKRLEKDKAFKSYLDDIRLAFRTKEIIPW